MFDTALLQRAERLVKHCIATGQKIVTAESCTGGLVAALLVSIPGSSAALERGFVTYSNAAKMDNLGVPADVLKANGAVSAATARAMATGALHHAPVSLAIAITGIAGPDGGSPDKPVGLVHFAAAASDGRLVHVEHRFGALGRNEVRMAAVELALGLLEDLAGIQGARP